MKPTKGFAIKVCEDCGRQMRRFRVMEKKYVCYSCSRKYINVIGSANPLTLEKALNKVYEIKGYVNGQGQMIAYRSFPTTLIGHKVKLLLIK